MEDKKARRNAYLAEWRAKNREKIRAQQDRYYQANKEVCDQRAKDSQAKNRAYYTKKTTDWQKANRERHLATKRANYVRNREKEIRRVRMRQGIIKHGALWTTPADQVEIDGLYLFTACFPWFEVDHVIPLRAKHHSGLHVLNNLQVITKAENRAKRGEVCPAYVELREGMING